MAACKELSIAAIDLNGRACLRAPRLLVDRSPLPDRAFSYELELRNIFVGKSARIVQHLISQGFVEKISAREFRLRDWHALLDEWVQSDRFPKRTRTTLYAGSFGPPQELAHRLQQWADSEKVPLAFTQWIAAWTRHPYTEPVVCSAYVARLPEAVTLEQMGLRPVTEGGKLWLPVPYDEGILSETQRRGSLTLVSDAQIYLDLQRTGLRGPDAVSVLKEWEGFCRP